MDNLNLDNLNLDNLTMDNLNMDNLTMDNLNMDNVKRTMSGLPAFKKRFTNELPSIFKLYKNPRIEYFDEYIKMEIFYSGINILFTFSRNYPFKPPIVKLNNIPYFKYLTFNFNRIQCMCCISRLCLNNWCPAFKLPTIIGDIYKTIHIKQQRTRLILIRVIKTKYLNQDIPLEDFI